MQKQASNTTRIFESHSVRQTEAWAENFARQLDGSAIIALIGDLGCGKTVIARGLGKGLDVQESVISPTFNYLLEYSGRLPMFHADLYRIEGSSSFTALGLDEYFDRKGVFVIEWAERIRELLPESTIEIKIKAGVTEKDRIIEVRKGKG